MTASTEIRAAMVEAAYRELYQEDDENEAVHRRMIGHALTAAILAAEARGFKLVGPEATLDMLNAGWEKMFGETAGPTSEVHYAMHAAAPGWGDGA